MKCSLHFLKERICNFCMWTIHQEIIFHISLVWWMLFGKALVAHVSDCKEGMVTLCCKKEKKVLLHYWFVSCSCTKESFVLYIYTIGKRKRHLEAFFCLTLSIGEAKIDHLYYCDWCKRGVKVQAWGQSAQLS